MHSSQTYPSDRTDLEWKLLEPLIAKPKSGGRPIAHTRRTILNAIFYLNRTGCQWSMLPKDFVPKSTVFDYFSAWRKSGLWAALNHRLRVKVRVAEGRKPTPTAAILDRQSVKGAEQGGTTVGFDAGKKDRRAQAPCARGHPGPDPGRRRDCPPPSRTGREPSRCFPASTFSFGQAANHLGRWGPMPAPWSGGSKGCVPSAYCTWTWCAAATTRRASNWSESAGSSSAPLVDSTSPAASP